MKNACSKLEQAFVRPLRGSAYPIQLIEKSLPKFAISST